MKRLYKSPLAPARLQVYLQANPHGTWQAMQGGVAPDGRQSALDCRKQAVQDQHGLCAYCERRISASDPLHCRVEHFHPKSHVDSSSNWGLDWQNMLAVCDGGERSSENEQKTHPLPANLSCDAHKNHAIQKNRLPEQCEGFLINPLELPSFPRNKKVLRKKGFSPQQAPEKLIERYFSTPWPEFFTTLRCCLGQAAEDHLRSVNYQG